MNLKYMLTWAKWVDRNTRILREKKHGCQELLHSHHTLHKVIHVHISHFWGFCSCNAIMMLNLVSCKTHLAKSIKEYYIRYYIKIYLAHLKKNQHNTHLRDSPSDGFEFVHGPLFPDRAIRILDPVPHKQRLRSIGKGTGSSCNSFQNIPGGIEPCPCLKLFWKQWTNKIRLEMQKRSHLF